VPRVNFLTRKQRWIGRTRGIITHRSHEVIIPVSAVASFIFETLVTFAGVILALNVAAALILALYLCRPKKRTYQDEYVFTPFETGVDHHLVSFQTADGVTIWGWWLSGRTDRVVVGLTGRSGTKSDLLGVGTYLAKAGFHVLLIDFRGRGQSQSAPLSLGSREALDAAAAMDYAAARIPGAKIGVIGFSLGAAVAVMAAAADARVLSLVIDSPFAKSETMMRIGMRRFFPVTRALFIPALARMWTMILYGFDPGGIDIPACARNSLVRRSLVIVSGRDSVIPPAQQRSVYEALPHPKELWEVPDADHCGAYFADRQRYVERIVRFFSETLDAR
jgi:uncharacterized protein